MMKGRGPTRGESDVELVVQEIEDDEHVEYLEAEDAVRYVARWHHTNPEAVQEGAFPEREPRFETTPFDRWGESQCISAAARAAAKHVNDDLAIDEVDGGITSLGSGEDRAAFVLIETILNRDGELVHEPSVSFDTLVTATPATVEVTYHLGGLVYQMDAPVYAEHSVLQYD